MIPQTNTGLDSRIAVIIYLCDAKNRHLDFFSVADVEINVLLLELLDFLNAIE